jgi:hypothetical protein
MAQTELKPCPFCGGKMRIESEYRFPWRNRLRRWISRITREPETEAFFTVCQSCAAVGPWGKSKSTAIRLNNMRCENGTD